MAGTPDNPGGAPAWEAVLRSMLGDQYDTFIAQLRSQGFDPEQLLGDSGIGGSPEMLQAALARVQQMLSQDEEGPVNIQLARELARQLALSQGGDPVVAPADAKQVTAAFSAAELWLDAATDLPPAGGPVHAWSRSEWVEATLGTIATLAEPVAKAVTDALVALFSEEFPFDPTAGDGEIPGLGLPSVTGIDADPLTMFRRLGSAVYGMQVGQATGTLSLEALGATDIGIPTLTAAGVALVPRNVDAFAEDLSVPADEVRIFLALHEAASARLFGHVPWLRAHVLALIADYAREVRIDTEALESAVREINPTDINELQKALSSGVFAPQTNATQRAALLRLETALALVEGWIDDVVATAAAPHLPHVGALREMIQRRRATGGPAEATFATLVGLELRPRRARDAAALWAAVRADGGAEAREALWAHPDLLPTAADLDSPGDFVALRALEKQASSDIDDAISSLLDESDGGN